MQQTTGSGIQISFFNHGETLKALAAAGELTRAHLEEALKVGSEDRYARYGRRRTLAHDQLPWEYVSQELPIDRSNVEGRQNVPQTVRWIIKHPEVFLAVPMDHAAFIRRLLSDEVIGDRVQFEMAVWPSLLEYLPIDERWKVLESIVIKYGARVPWTWPKLAATWDAERARTLVRELVTLPELASAFLSAEYAWVGWWVFTTMDEFRSVVWTASVTAPYEALQNAKRLAMRLAEIKTGSIYEDVSILCLNMFDEYIDEMSQKASDELAKLLRLADEKLRMLLSARGDQPVSNTTASSLASIAKHAELTDDTDVPALVEIILDLGSTEAARTLAAPLLAKMTRENAGRICRYALAAKRDVTLSDGPHDETYVQSYPREDELKASWLGDALLGRLRELGWRIVTAQECNDRGRIGVEVVAQESGPRVIVKIKRGRYGLTSVSKGQKAFVPPDPSLILGSRILYENDRTKIILAELDPVRPDDPRSMKH